MKHVMIDLESMGQSALAAIIAIGAVAFDPTTGKLGESFYCVVDLQSSMNAGMTIDASTVLWWLKQSDEARKALQSPGAPLLEALMDLEAFLKQVSPNRKELIVWANGASFDFPILATAFRAHKARLPWDFWNERCARTLIGVARTLFGYQKPVIDGTAHNALDDATFQAQIVMEILAKLSATTLVTIAENLREEAAA